MNTIIDNLIKLLNSEDKELRELGVSYILNNYKLPEVIYYNLNTGYYTFTLKKEKFKCTREYIFNNLQQQIRYSYWFNYDELKSFLNTIITYNEKYK